jgi:hypothetical protein
MTALSATTTGTKKSTSRGGVLTPSYLTCQVIASEICYYGGMGLLDGGYVKAATGTAEGHLRAVGRFVGTPPTGGQDSPETDVDNSDGSSGDKEVLVETGIFSMVNDTGDNALADADFGTVCYLKDDQTVSKSSNNHNYAVAGLFLGLDPDNSRPWVAIGLSDGQLPRIMVLPANADLSALQYTIVKLANDTGVAEVASATAGTDVVVGVLVNAPTAGKPARVVTHGPAPLKAVAGGYTAGAQLAAGAAGAADAAAAAEYFVGHALETAGASATKMCWVQPGILAA